MNDNLPPAADKCPDDQALVAFLEARMDPSGAARIEDHVDRCRTCRRLRAAAARDRVTRASRPRGATEHGEIEAALPLRRGESVGRYVVIDLVGQGGMGMVYVAYDPELNRRVALKLVRSDQEQAPAGTRARDRDRLLREAQAMARISHPNVITVYDVNTWREQVFVAMEYVEGQDLRRWLGAERRTEREILEAFLQAGRGLAAAHARGLVHRDFKPENVLVVGDGRVQVTDFGLVRPLERNGDGDGLEAQATPDVKASPLLFQSLTRTGALVGTPAYMAPEQHRGKEVDGRSDQFAYCVALYEALYGQHPFPHDSFEALAAAVMAGRVAEAPRDSRVPARLRAILVRGLAVAPEARFPSMDALLAALADRPARRWRWGLLAVAAIAGALLMGFGIAQVRSRRGEMCRGAERRLEGVWDASIKQAGRAAFAKLGLPYGEPSWRAAESVLDGYARDWAEMHREACEATHVRGEQSAELLDRRMQCLRRRLDEIKALTGLLAQADARVVDNAVQAVARLRPLAACADAEALLSPLPQPDPAVRDRVDALRTALTRARALASLGQFPESRHLAEQTTDAARKLGYAPLLAESLSALGRAQVRVSDLERAERTLSESIWLAEATRHDQVQVEALLELLVVLKQGADRPRFDWISHQAEATLARLGSPEWESAILDQVVGTGLVMSGREQEGLACLERSVARCSRVFGPRHIQTMDAKMHLAWVLSSQGRQRDALAHAADAFHEAERQFGADHPRLQNARSIMGNIHVALGNTSEAIALAERGLAISTRIGGPDNPGGSAFEGILVSALKGAERYEEALRHARRCLELSRRSGDAQLYNQLLAHLEVIDLLFALRRYEEIEEQIAQVLRIAERTQGSDGADKAGGLRLLARLEGIRKRPDKALRHLEASLAILLKPANAGQLVQRAATCHALAETLHRLGREPQRAHSLAEQARALFAQARMADEEAKVERLLHDMTRRP